MFNSLTSKNIFYFFYLYLTCCILLPLTVHAQFETPLLSKSTDLQDSDLVEDEKVVLLCKIYNHYTVVEKIEPGFVANTIYSKYSFSMTKEEKLKSCDDIDLKSFTSLNHESASFWGGSNKYIFLKDADELSARTKFEIFNSETGEKTFSGVRNNNQLFKIIPLSNHVFALEYFQKFSSSCKFETDKESKSYKSSLNCWKEFLKSNEVDIDIQLPYPRCAKTTGEKKVQLYLKVQIPDINKSKRKFLWAKPLCEAAL